MALPVYHAGLTRKEPPLRRLSRYCRLVLFAVIAAGLAPAAVRAETNLVFCFDPYPPYTFAENGEITGGLKVDLLQAVVAQIDGLSAEVRNLPWKRCQAQAEAGDVDGILPLFKTPARERYLAFTTGTFHETYNFWFRRERFPGGFDWDGDIASIRDLRLGVLTGAFIAQQLEEGLAPGNAIVWVKDVGSLMQMLEFGRVDLAVTDRMVGGYTVRSNGWQNSLQMVETPIASKPSYFALSRTSGADAYLEDFNRAITRLRAEGALQAILNGSQ